MRLNPKKVLHGIRCEELPTIALELTDHLLRMGGRDGVVKLAQHEFRYIASPSPQAKSP